MGFAKAADWKLISGQVTGKFHGERANTQQVAICERYVTSGVVVEPNLIAIVYFVADSRGRCVQLFSGVFKSADVITHSVRRDLSRVNRLADQTAGREQELIPR